MQSQLLEELIFKEWGFDQMLRALVHFNAGDVVQGLLDHQSDVLRYDWG